MMDRIIILLLAVVFSSCTHIRYRVAGEIDLKEDSTLADTEAEEGHYEFEFVTSVPLNGKASCLYGVFCSMMPNDNDEKRVKKKIRRALKKQISSKKFKLALDDITLDGYTDKDDYLVIDTDEGYKQFGEDFKRLKVTFSVLPFLFIYNFGLGVGYSLDEHNEIRVDVSGLFALIGGSDTISSFGWRHYTESGLYLGLGVAQARSNFSSYRRDDLNETVHQGLSYSLGYQPNDNWGFGLYQGFVSKTDNETVWTGMIPGIEIYMQFL